MKKIICMAAAAVKKRRKKARKTINNLKHWRKLLCCVKRRRKKKKSEKEGKSIYISVSTISPTYSSTYLYYSLSLYSSLTSLLLICLSEKNNQRNDNCMLVALTLSDGAACDGSCCCGKSARK